MKPEELEHVLDDLMADGFSTMAFMIEIAAELAQQKPDPEEWSRALIGLLHRQLDANEKAMSGVDWGPVYEKSRQRIDALGVLLSARFRRDGSPNPT